MGPNPTRVRVDWVRFPCSTPVRGKISAAPPRCSPDTRLDNKPRECAPGEQRGGADEILPRTKVEHGKRNPIYTYLGCPWITWTIRKDDAYKYAKTCIFIGVALSNGRRLGYET